MSEKLEQKTTTRTIPGNSSSMKQPIIVTTDLVHIRKTLMLPDCSEPTLIDPTPNNQLLFLISERARKRSSAFPLKCE